MALKITDNGGVVRDVLEVQDLEPTKFSCIGGVIQPIVSLEPITSGLLGTGSTNSPLTVNISTDLGNELILGTDDGLYAPAPIYFTDKGLTGDITNAGTPLEVLISSDADNALIFGTDDGLYIKAGLLNTGDGLTGSGTLISPLEVLLSTDIGNDISFGTDGGIFLNVPAFGGFLLDDDVNTPELIIPGDTMVIKAADASVDVTLLPAGNKTLSISAVVDPVAGNRLSLTGNGLYVPPETAETVTTFVDNGNGTFTYTSENATETTICQGPNTVIQPAAACASWGSGFMVTDVDITDCELTVVSAPEHTAAQDSIGYTQGPISVDIGAIGFTSDVTCITVTAPPCRAAVAEIDISHRYEIDYTSNGVLSNLRVAVEVADNAGGPWTEIGVINKSYNLTSGNTMSVGDTHEERQFVTIPAGTSQTFCTRLRVTGSPVGNLILTGSAGGISYIWHTE